MLEEDAVLELLVVALAVTVPVPELVIDVVNEAVADDETLGEGTKDREEVVDAVGVGDRLTQDVLTVTPPAAE